METRRESPQSAAGLWDDIRARLEREQARIYAEIRSYPAPIPGCDQHYAHLLESRDRISRELARMHEARRAEPDGGRVETFLADSEFFAGAIAADLLRRAGPAVD